MVPLAEQLRKPMRLIQWLPLITPFKAVFVRHGLVAFAVEVS
jgi:hypothetical protein